MRNVGATFHSDQGTSISLDSVDRLGVALILHKTMRRASGHGTPLVIFTVVSCSSIVQFMHSTRPGDHGRWRQCKLQVMSSNVQTSLQTMLITCMPWSESVRGDTLSWDMFSSQHFSSVWGCSLSRWDGFHPSGESVYYDQNLRVPLAPRQGKYNHRSS